MVEPTDLTSQYTLVTVERTRAPLSWTWRGAGLGVLLGQCGPKCGLSKQTTKRQNFQNSDNVSSSGRDTNFLILMDLSRTGIGVPEVL